jgi:hypothetical protein
MIPGIATFPVCKHSRAVGDCWMGMSKTTITCPLCETEKLHDRIRELEDTILRNEAEASLSSSYGRNDWANRVLEDIAIRRGSDWTGATVEWKEVPR